MFWRVDSMKGLIKYIVKVFRRLIPDKLYIQRRYYKRFHKKCNLDNPVTYNEKLQWLKLYNRKQEYTKMVDKYDVKQYVSKLIGSEYIIPTLGVWDRFDDIDFDKLPNQFVLKCTHDSGGVIIVKDKKTFDKERARKKINSSMRFNYYWNGREWPYKNIKPRIIAEQYMVDDSGYELKDYKFFCFNGTPKCMLIATDRTDVNKETRFDYFDMDFNFLPFEWVYKNSHKKLVKPLAFDEMKEIAKTLSINIPHVRVDLYEVKGKVYFGELTFFHQGGMAPFKPQKWDVKLGEWIELPIEKN